jgi:hypothetical protein
MKISSLMVMVVFAACTVGVASAGPYGPYPGGPEFNVPGLPNGQTAFPYEGLVLNYNINDIQTTGAGVFDTGTWQMQVTGSTQDGWTGTTVTRMSSGGEKSMDWEYSPDYYADWLGPPLWINLQDPTSAGGAYGNMWTVQGQYPGYNPSAQGGSNLVLMDAKGSSGTEYSLVYDDDTGMVVAYTSAVPGRVTSWSLQSVQ